MHFVTDRQMDTDIVALARDVYITSHAKDRFSVIHNDLLHEFIDKAVVLFSNRFWSCVAANGGQW